MGIQSEIYLMKPQNIEFWLVFYYDKIWKAAIIFEDLIGHGILGHEFFIKTITLSSYRTS